MNAVHIADEVRSAVDAGRPVVALESTLISHGLPRPRNLGAARRLEAVVRAGGAVPATIGVVSGQLTVGLSAAELELLATAPDVRKCSRRDLPVVMARGEHGATTVAGTLAVMGLAGLRVLATGGLGGVHRGADETFDVSADLPELARTRAVVVCAGAKALLDLPRTVELLETLGVPVLGWRTDELPAFYASRGGLPVAARVESAEGVAAIARAAWESDLARGLLLGVPPPPTSSVDADELERVLATALDAARQAGVTGARTTPFLLDAVARATGGQSLEANLALLENNARVGAEIAVALAEAPQPPKIGRLWPPNLGGLGGTQVTLRLVGATCRARRLIRLYPHRTRLRARRHRARGGQDGERGTRRNPHARRVDRLRGGRAPAGRSHRRRRGRSGRAGRRAGADAGEDPDRRAERCRLPHHE